MKFFKVIPNMSTVPELFLHHRGHTLDWATLYHSNANMKQKKGQITTYVHINTMVLDMQ